jgi:hypothetical protein
MIITSTPSNRGPLINRDTLSNIRNYSIATTESWGNYFTGNASAASDGYLQPGTTTLSLNIIEKGNAGDFYQCFLVTHHSVRSNSGTNPTLVQSNTPLIIDLASNNVVSASNLANNFNYFNGALITNI